MEYLSQRGIAFTAKDVSSDEQAVRELTQTYNSHSTPTIVVDGKVMIGFDKARLEAMLK